MNGLAIFIDSYQSSRDLNFKQEGNVRYSIFIRQYIGISVKVQCDASHFSTFLCEQCNFWAEILLVLV